MFYSSPTVEELLQSDLSDLIDMLAKQSSEHTRLSRSQGTSPQTAAIKDLIIRIQTAIEIKTSRRKPISSK